MPFQPTTMDKKFAINPNASEKSVSQGNCIENVVEFTEIVVLVKNSPLVGLYKFKLLKFKSREKSLN